MDNQSLRPLFSRIGTKRDIAQNLISQFPEHETYIEPFFGGGAVYWKKTPSKREVINDLDKDIMTWLSYIKTHKMDVNKFPSLNTVEKNKAFFDSRLKNQEEALAHEIISRGNGFTSGHVVKKSSQIYKPSNPFSKLRKIDAYRRRLQNTIIMHVDYLKVIKKYDSAHSFFFLDPPYEDSKGFDYARHMFDFNKLASVLKQLKGKFLLTVNDSPNLRDIFKSFHIKSITVKPKGNGGIGSKARKELVIRNY